MNKIKVIFLDIDGVLNFQRMSKKDTIGDELEIVSKKCVGYLNQLVSETDAKIVISSTWRKRGNAPELLKSYGVNADIIDVTPVLSGNYIFRGNEIYAWMCANSKLIGNQHDFKRYIILDDDSDMLLWQYHHYINVDNCTGLTPNIIYKAKRLLNSFA